jgi:glycosyltransferase involved in cell wall biosynthesis
MVHGESGWLVAPNDGEALAAGLDALLPAPDLRARLAAAGRTAARAFDAPVIAARYEAFFGTLAAQGPCLAQRQ